MVKKPKVPERITPATPPTRASAAPAGGAGGRGSPGSAFSSAFSRRSFQPTFLPAETGARRTLIGGSV